VGKLLSKKDEEAGGFRNKSPCLAKYEQVKGRRPNKGEAEAFGKKVNLCLNSV